MSRLVKGGFNRNVTEKHSKGLKQNCFGFVHWQLLIRAAFVHINEQFRPAVYFTGSLLCSGELGYLTYLRQTLWPGLDKTAGATACLKPHGKLSQQENYSWMVFTMAWFSNAGVFSNSFGETIFLLEKVLTQFLMQFAQSLCTMHIQIEHCIIYSEGII